LGEDKIEDRLFEVSMPWSRRYPTGKLIF